MTKNTNSTHTVETFILDGMSKHPNADSLSLIKIADTDYTYVARTEEWVSRVGQLVAWVPPDSVVDLARPEFSWLTNQRIKAKKLRGIVSYGLLVPAPAGLKAGDDAASALGVTHYEPPMTGQKKSYQGNEVAPAPKGVYPKYDVEAFLKYGRKVFKEGELVYVTEKIHGANGRYVFMDGEMHCGSRTEWKKALTSPPNITLEQLTLDIGDPVKAEQIYNTKVLNHVPKKNLWWLALPDAVRHWCADNPGFAVYGEVYGNVQSFKYGATTEVWFRAFDILRPDGTWLDSADFVKVCDVNGIARVPEIGVMPFDCDKLIALAEGKSLIADHIKEGIVVKPVIERYDDRVGRVSLKIINPAYLEKN